MDHMVLLDCAATEQPRPAKPQLPGSLCYRIKKAKHGAQSQRAVQGMALWSHFPSGEGNRLGLGIYLLRFPMEQVRKELEVNQEIASHQVCQVR